MFLAYERSKKRTDKTRRAAPSRFRLWLFKKIAAQAFHIVEGAETLLLHTADGADDVSTDDCLDLFRGIFPEDHYIGN